MLQDCIIDICIKINPFTTESVRISDMNNFAVCLQIDPVSDKWGLSARSVDLKCMWDPDS